ncbi:uncharacterized protein [Macrobrachium rosenbergii]|uniref:uncharacterized protein n=1 Tax=Macrobrachium rosenbergii TaxID=79674 RepID=UPI0034D39E4B
MEMVRTVLSAIREDDFMLTMDLMDAYFQVPVHPSSHRCLRFVLKGVVYQFRVLCFGLDRAAGIHASVHLGVSLGPFTWDTSSEVSRRLVSPGKLPLAVPTGQRSPPRVVLRTRYRDQLQEVGSHFQTEDSVSGHADRYGSRQSLSLTGSNQHVQEGGKAVPVKAGTASSTVASRDRSPVVIGEARTAWSTPPSVSPVETEGLLGSVSGAPVSSRTHLSGDASKEGWDAHLEELLTSGVWDHHDKHLHINVLEMKAAFVGLQCFQDHLMGHSMVLMSDNTTVVAYVNKQGGLVSHALHALTVQVHQWAVTHSMELSARYIPGKRNVLADMLSLQDQMVGSE